MAREQRKDVDYFPHDCIHGRKMNIIESKYGNDGYATWFKLLEQLGKANNHYLDISDEMTLMFLTSTFKIDEEKTFQILNDLARLGAIDRFLFEEYKIIWSEKFTNSIEDAYRKRKNRIFQYSDVLNEIQQKNGQSSGSYRQSSAGMPEVIPKEEKSKEEKSKEDFADESAGDFSEESQQQICPKKAKEKIKKVAPKKEKEQPPEFWQNYVDMWFNFYKAEFPINPTFNATEGKHLKSIVTRFEKMAKEKDVDENIDHKWTLDRAMRTFEKFLNNAWGDKWLKEHFLLKNLVSNYDSIISKKTTENENGNQQQQSSGTKKQFRFSTSQAIKTITGTDT